ncbi:hypothetical protein HYC85_005848 [Camellia sinensis]|uniref:Translocon-associated protein subunit beta n=1 Tax=Camellia sinensis TaxID=4442 RepID=A0A7J7I0M9_CAMSI|nr:hypothetical protein HYC85_005848 [Camellia sinensis]
MQNELNKPTYLVGRVRSARLSSSCPVDPIKSGPEKHSTMTIQIAKCLISVLIALFFVSSVVASSDAPFIRRSQEGHSHQAQAWHRTCFRLTRYLQPRICIFLTVSSGNTSMSWERLDAGAILSHAFELESKVQTLFYGAPAVITFRVPTKAALQEAYSTPIMPLDILADRPPEKKFELRLLAKYGSLISVLSIVTLFVYLVATPSKSGAAKGGKKKR